MGANHQDHPARFRVCGSDLLPGCLTGDVRRHQVRHVTRQQTGARGTVDHEQPSGDERRRVTGQEERRIRNVLGSPFRRIAVCEIMCSRTSGPNPSSQPRRASVSIAPGSTAFTRMRGASSAAISRVNCPSADLVRLWVNCPRTASSPTTEPMLRIDSVTAAQQMRHGEPAQLERDEHVEMKGLRQLVNGGFQEWPRNRATGVVDQDIETAEFGHDMLDQPAEEVQVVDVPGQHERPPAALPNRRGHGFEVVDGARRQAPRRRPPGRTSSRSRRRCPCPRR